MSRVVTAALLPAASAAHALSPEESLAAIELHPDFQIEIVAHEPGVFDPVDLEFDEHGRPFVIEMPGYPFPDSPGRVVLLKDSDNDGLYETRHIFADGFPVADSIMPYDGGILVASPPDLVFLKDTDGDDVADVRETWLTGFTVGNPQHNFNGLTYGIDNWIYGANGGNSGRVHWSAKPDEKIALRFDDFRLNPRKNVFERYGKSTGGFEITFDEWGRMFATHNLRPASHLVFPGKHIEEIPQPSRGPLHELPDDIENGLVRIYPIGEQDTRVNHPEQSGYFSGACGITYYGGGAFGPDFENNLFVCDVVLNLVHRRVLEPSGTSFVARRPRDKVEFLASRDRAFRPVNMTVAPDGALWLLDMRRDVIEHPEWIPDEIETGLDLDAGKAAGRVYRITPKGGLPPANPNFDRNNLESVVAALEHPNQWWRLTAQRLLVEWQDTRAVDPLLALAQRPDAPPVARVHALWTLDGLGAPDAEVLRAVSNLRSDAVQENVVRLAEKWSLPEISDTVGRRALQAQAPAYRTILAYLLTVPELDPNRRESWNILANYADDPFIRLAAIPPLQPHTPTYLARLVRPGEDPVPDPAGTEVTRLLAEAYARHTAAAELIALLNGIQPRSADDARLAAMLHGLAKGIGVNRAADRAVNRGPLEQALARFVATESAEVVRETFRLARALALDTIPGRQAWFDSAAQRVRDPNADTAERVEQARILAFAPFASREELLFDLLDPRQPKELQREAIAQLQEHGTPQVARRIIAMWRALGPETRPVAGDILLYNRRHHDLLLSALENRTISLGEMNLHLERRRTLLNSRDEDIRTRAQALFSDAGVVTRKEAIERMRPALTLRGIPQKGSEIFANLCARCHQMGEEGGDLGPNLTEIARKSKETLLHDILDPNAAVDAQYIAYNLETNRGELVTGLLDDETATTVTIRDANGRRSTIPRTDIRELFSSGLSLMPEELESGLDHQAMADLLAFLQEPR